MGKRMTEVKDHDEPVQVVYTCKTEPYGFYRVQPICPRCRNVLRGDEKRCPFCNQKFIWGEKND